MNKFKLVSSFKPTGDQPEAIDKLIEGIKVKHKHQVLLGVTGSGKTFTVANVIHKLNLPTLVISHNKTLAGQLYQEFRDFFPENAISYFVSYYDYYQPEAYIPHSDTYIEKETAINEEIDKLRLKATANLLTRSDTLVVASVSSIYNIGSPEKYGYFAIKLKVKDQLDRMDLFSKLTQLQYSRGSYEFVRGTFRVRGDSIDIYPAYTDIAYRIQLKGNIIYKIVELDPLTGMQEAELNEFELFPAKHYIADPDQQKETFKVIRRDLHEQVNKFKNENKLIEAQRLNQRVNFDLEMLNELGYVNGIENYSRYFDGRAPGEPPYSLMDYFNYRYKNNWLLVIDESHMTIPQIRGMYKGDMSRKKTLIDYGFRLPAAIDNRPLRFDEYLRRTHQTIYTSATPSDWEKSLSQQVVQQLVRPTGLLDPEIEIRSSKNQIRDLISEILIRKQKGERVLVTTFTKKIAEDLSKFIGDYQELQRLDKDLAQEAEKLNLKVQYLHSDVDTLDRQDILDDLRLGTYDVLVGINLLREGLDLPEVSLVAILDADKEGFLRSETSLIQTMGRAARHENGHVIMYADKVTNSMKKAIDEVSRRRKVQKQYNINNGITPTGISKPIRDKLIERTKKDKNSKQKAEVMIREDYNQLLPNEQIKYIKELTKMMKTAARELNFEEASFLRDKISGMKNL